MSPLPCYTVIKYNGSEGRFLPKIGEIIALCFSQDLFGPGSEFGTHHDLPSRATRYNYHHPVVLRIVMDDHVSFTILPMPTYSSADPGSGLSSTSWLLAQSKDFQQLHIPVPFEEDPTHPHPPFPTPAGFGPPLQISGWKSAKPCWVQAVPQAVELEKIATFKCFDPRVVLSPDEVKRLMRYCIPHSLPVVSSSVPLTGHGSPTHPPGGSNNGIGPSAGSSLAVQTLYANEAVKHPLADITPLVKSIDDSDICGNGHEDDEEDDDDDSDWEKDMDLITFARLYAATIPFLAEVVKEHDEQMGELRNQHVANWLEGVRSVTS